MKELLEQTHPQTLLFKDASGASEEDIALLKQMIDSIPELPADPIEAAKAVRLYLIQNGFNYDEKAFSMQDILEKKGGNCLGLALLFGTIMQEKGFDPEFKMLIHPDTAQRADELAFNYFYSEYLDYQNPQLPKLLDQIAHGINHFLPLEHPILVLDDQPFETTFLGKEAVEEDPVYMPEAESVRPLSFSELLSCVYIDRANWLVRHATDAEEKDHSSLLDQMLQLTQKGLDVWPDNREGWCSLWGIACDMNDEKLKKKAEEEYQRIGGDDSRFYYNMYQMTGEEKYLDLTLEKYPQHVFAFIEKKVMREPDIKEAKANFAVALWCVSRSGYLDLNNFYKNERYSAKLKELYGEGVINKIFDKR